MIKVYGKERCGQCEALKTILNSKNMEFEYIEDKKQLMIIASKARIMSAPVIEYNGEIFSMDKFLKKIEE